MQSDDLGLVRYGVVAHDDGSDRMEPVARGQWVRADEAAAAIERLVAERDEARKKLTALHMEADRIDAQRIAAEFQRDRLIAALSDLALAVGDWSRPTGANGMVAAREDHPLLVAVRRARQALKDAP